MLRAACVLCLVLTCGRAATARAQEEAALSPLGPTPYAAAIQRQFYQRVRRDPLKALGWELLVPGGGHYYVGLRVHSAVLLSLSVTGAALWAAGSLSDRSAVAWTGLWTFVAARGYGLASAPVSAALFNAVLRRQLALRF